MRVPRRIPHRSFVRGGHRTVDDRLEAAQRSPDRFRSGQDVAAAQFRDAASTLRPEEPPMSDIHAPILAVTVTVTTDDDRTLTERVELTQADFTLVATNPLQALSFLQEADPDLYDAFQDGDASLPDLAGDITRVRALIYAVTRAALTDSRIRAQMAVTDLALSMDALTEIMAAVGSLPDDLADQITTPAP